MKEFQKNALTPSELGSFYFCEAQPIVRNRARELGLLPRGMRAGHVRHEVDLSWHVDQLGVLETVEVYTVDEALAWVESTLRRALGRNLVLANTLCTRTVASIVPELIPGRGLLGYPDALDCTGREPVVIEAKYTAPPLNGAWPGDALQVLGYLAGVAELGWVEPVGRIYYRGRVEEVVFSGCEASRLRRAATRLDEVDNGAEPVPSRRCGECWWCELCPWRR